MTDREEAPALRIEPARTVPHISYINCLSASERQRIWQNTDAYVYEQVKRRMTIWRTDRKDGHE